MKKILFVCHGNICRSPMAEFVMKDLAKKAGLASQFHMRQESPTIGRVSFVSGEKLEFADIEAFLNCVREELPYRSMTGFRFEVLTDDPTVRKAVDDIIFDFYGEENPRQLEEYQKTPDQGMTMGGM